MCDFFSAYVCHFSFDFLLLKCTNPVHFYQFYCLFFWALEGNDLKQTIDKMNKCAEAFTNQLRFSDTVEAAAEIDVFSALA